MTLRIHVNMTNAELITRIKYQLNSAKYLVDPDDVTELLLRFEELEYMEWEDESI